VCSPHIQIKNDFNFYRNSVFTIAEPPNMSGLAKYVNPTTIIGAIVSIIFVFPFLLSLIAGPAIISNGFGIVNSTLALGQQVASNLLSSADVIFGQTSSIINSTLSMSSQMATSMIGASGQMLASVGQVSAGAFASLSATAASGMAIGLQMTSQALLTFGQIGVTIASSYLTAFQALGSLAITFGMMYMQAYYTVVNTLVIQTTMVLNTLVEQVVAQVAAAVVGIATTAMTQPVQAFVGFVGTAMITVPVLVAVPFTVIARLVAKMTGSTRNMQYTQAAGMLSMSTSIADIGPLSSTAITNGFQDFIDSIPLQFGTVFGIPSI